MKDVQLPEIAENVEEGTVTGILVSEGDEVSESQNILELETDKASVEVPAPFAGTVAEITVSEGDTVAVGDVVMRFDESGSEESASRAEDAESQDEQSTGASGKPDEDKPRDDDREKPSLEAADSRKDAAADVPASPATRRLARELGVDITAVEGSGARGRVSQEDVKRAARGGSPAGTQRDQQGAAGGAGKDSGDESREPMTRVRALTAERTQQSWQQVPHVTHFDEADTAGLQSFIESNASKVEKRGGKLTVTAVLVKLCAHALRSFPRFNASIDMEAGELVYHHGIGMGVAVDTERGLLVPVLRDPDRKSVADIAVELGELATAARDGSLSPDRMQGGTFSLSNLGGIGGTGFTPVVVQPQVAILGVARAQSVPRLTNGRVTEATLLPLALSYDHRAIDGADGARFVSWLKTAIEDPFEALMMGGA